MLPLLLLYAVPMMMFSLSFELVEHREEKKKKK
jgi:hypothetical protein